MKNSTNWTKKPVTWGAVIITSLISAIIGLIQVALMFGAKDKVKGTFNSIKKKIRLKKKPK